MKKSVIKQLDEYGTGLATPVFCFAETDWWRAVTIASHEQQHIDDGEAEANQIKDEATIATSTTAIRRRRWRLPIGRHKMPAKLAPLPHYHFVRLFIDAEKYPCQIWNKATATTNKKKKKNCLPCLMSVQLPWNLFSFHFFSLRHFSVTSRDAWNALYMWKWIAIMNVAPNCRNDNFHKWLQKSV